MADDDAAELAQRFIDAFNARELGGIRELVADGVELRDPSGDKYRGSDGAHDLLAAAAEANVRVVPDGEASVKQDEEMARVSVPVKVVAGDDERPGTAELEVRERRIALFAVEPAD